MSTEEVRCGYLLDDGSDCPRSTTSESEYCKQHSLAADLEVFRAVTDHFRQDLREFWVRSNFYLLVQAGLISVFVAAVPEASTFQRAVGLAMGGLGLAVAIVWFIVARGAVMWIRIWRQQTIAMDEIVDRHRVYANVESMVKTAPLMSPSNVTQYLPLVFCTAWLALLAETIWAL